MKYRVICDLAFKRKMDADALWNQIGKILPQAVIINKDKPGEESYTGNIHRCYHDEAVPKPCVIIKKISKDSGVITGEPV